MERHIMFTDMFNIFNQVETAVLPQIKLWFNSKVPAGYFEDRDKLILNFIWKDKGTRIAKNNFEKK